MRAKDIIALAEIWLNENYSHYFIVKIYNSIRPLPQNYQLKNEDSWCAAFVSALFWTVSAGDKEAFTYECGCERMVRKASDRKIWIEDESIKPKAGWVVVYDWNDSVKPSDCIGWSDHVGIIVKVNDKTFETIEGNVNGRIKRKTVKYNDKNLRGYIAPRYDKPDDPRDIHTIAMEVITGLWGSGKTRKERLTAAGYDYKSVQAEVNKIMKELS